MRWAPSLLLAFAISGCAGQNIDGVSARAMSFPEDRTYSQGRGYGHYPVSARETIQSAIPEIIEELGLHMISGYETGPDVFRARTTIRNEEITDVHHGVIVGLLAAGLRPSATEESVDYDLSIVLAPITVAGDKLLELSVRIQINGHFVGGGSSFAYVSVPEGFFENLHEKTGLTPIELQYFSKG